MLGLNTADTHVGVEVNETIISFCPWSKVCGKLNVPINDLSLVVGVSGS